MSIGGALKYLGIGLLLIAIVVVVVVVEFYHAPSGHRPEGARGSNKILVPMKNSLHITLPEVFPGIALIFCPWYINKNILSCVRKAIRKYLQIEIDKAKKEG